MTKKKEIDQDVLKKLQESKNAVLERIAKSLESQAQGETLNAGHSSHSSSPNGKGHTSVVSH